MRAGRGLEGLDGVGVRVGGASVTLAVRAGAAAALRAVTSPPTPPTPRRHAPAHRYRHHSIHTRSYDVIYSHRKKKKFWLKVKHQLILSC
ncbi:unnamed protein product [Euphydryas editha]|uniref:Uncharacterized protein n=1 Tax=Euphydryas editha TaxID=104508 RepID=A0AAU9V7U9_EUPED|nr:unnamed protein product [Euphydryas editha]